MTTQPASAARGAWTLETAEPGENRPMSIPAKSNAAKSRTASVTSSPKETSLPTEFREARAMTSSAGNARSASTASSWRPTFPVAPATATR